jgi:hypothetical protein
MGFNTVLLLRTLAGGTRIAIDAFANQGQGQQQGRGGRRRKKQQEGCTPCAAKANARAHLDHARKR